MAAPENKITTVDALKAAYPDLVATIQNEAAAAERDRIKGIEDLANGNYDAIAKDAKNSGANGVQGAAPEDNAGENGKNVFDAAIDKLFPDEK